MRPHTIASLPVWLLAMSSLAPLAQTSPSPQETGAKTWVGRYREVEEYLRTAECDAMENLGSATSATKRCVLRPGGPVSRMAWYPELPGGYRGFREDYKANIAAYEIDKLLKLDMVPPTVERELQGHKGSATFWVEKVLASNEGALPSGSAKSRWEKQLRRMMMFDNLIGNKDRNKANTLRDAAWNVILIDHTRAFGSDTELPHRLTEIDQDSWARIEKLTRKQLDDALRPWLDENEIAAILERRERMKADINKPVGQAGVLR